MKAYHFLRADMTTGSGTELPWEIGEERICHGAIVLCKFGYHSSPTLWDAFGYAPGPVACLVEISKPVARDGTKAAGNRKSVSTIRKLLRFRNVERELWLFAADCAERVLHIFEREYPEDKRPRLAIEAARDFANDKIDTVARAAAGAAALAAAGAAAGDAAGDAAWAAAGAAGGAAAGDAGGAAAWAAGRASAGDAAGAAAGAAGRAAERNWQRDHFNRMFDGIFDAELVEKEPKP